MAARQQAYDTPTPKTLLHIAQPACRVTSLSLLENMNMAADSSAIASLVLHTQSGHASPAVLVGGEKDSMCSRGADSALFERASQHAACALVQEELLGHDSRPAENGWMRLEKESAGKSLRQPGGPLACQAQSQALWWPPPPVLPYATVPP